ncbi:uncharacterized protein LOC110202059 [Phascolarctos cinereus]
MEGGCRGCGRGGCSAPRAPLHARPRPGLGDGCPGPAPAQARGSGGLGLGLPPAPARPPPSLFTARSSRPAAPLPRPRTAADRSLLPPLSIFPPFSPSLQELRARSGGGGASPEPTRAGAGGGAGRPGERARALCRAPTPGRAPAWALARAPASRRCALPPRVAGGLGLGAAGDGEAEAPGTEGDTLRSTDGTRARMERCGGPRRNVAGAAGRGTLSVGGEGPRGRRGLGRG